jgi:transcription factor TGA
LFHKLLFFLPQLLASHLEPLTEQQLASICNLQQSSQQAEEDLSQGVKALQQSVTETLASGSLCTAGSSGNAAADCSGQMAVAIGKLGTLVNFLQEVTALQTMELAIFISCFSLINVL